MKMKFNLNKSKQILKNTPLVLEELLKNLDTELLNNNEGGNTWSPSEIVCHLINCENVDWVPRIKIILGNETIKTFEPFDRTFGFEKSKTQSIKELLKEFKTLRKKNLNYLNSIEMAKETLNKMGVHPEFGEVTLKQLLSAWVVHDLSHIAQICRVISKQYKGEAGPWVKYHPILTK